MDFDVAAKLMYHLIRDCKSVPNSEEHHTKPKDEQPYFPNPKKHQPKFESSYASNHHHQKGKFGKWAPSHNTEPSRNHHYHRQKATGDYQGHRNPANFHTRDNHSPRVVKNANHIHGYEKNFKGSPRNFKRNPFVYPRSGYHNVWKNRQPNQGEINHRKFENPNSRKPRYNGKFHGKTSSYCRNFKKDSPGNPKYPTINLEKSSQNDSKTSPAKHPCPERRSATAQQGRSIQNENRMPFEELLDSDEWEEPLIEVDADD
jgi:hypothetical protein